MSTGHVNKYGKHSRHVEGNKHVKVNKRYEHMTSNHEYGSIQPCEHERIQAHEHKSIQNMGECEHASMRACRHVGIQNM